MDKLNIGDPVPELSGTDVDGKPFKLSDFRGRVVVIAFVDGPTAAFKALTEKFSRQSLVIIDVMRAPTRDAFEQPTANAEIHWTTTWDQGFPPPITIRWQTDGFPSAYVIDQRGVIRYREIYPRELEHEVESLLHQVEQVP